jgi:hypothetical protein
MGVREKTDIQRDFCYPYRQPVTSSLFTVLLQHSGMNLTLPCFFPLDGFDGGADE